MVGYRRTSRIRIDRSLNENGGKVIAQWLGLALDQRVEGRDLDVTTPYEGLFKGLLNEHLGVSDASLNEQVFPAHRSVPALTGLIKT